MDEAHGKSTPSIDRRALIRRAAAAGAAAWTAPLVLDSLASPAAASTPVVTTTTYYLRNTADAVATALANLLTTPGNSTVQKEIKADSASVQSQTDATKFQAWRTDVLAGGLTVTNQPVTLFLFQNNKDSSKTGNLVAGLFHCASTTGNTTSPSPCTFIASANLCVTGPNTSAQRTLSFGTLTFTVPAGSNLRVKVVDQSGVGSCLSDTDMFVQWNNGTTTPAGSRLVIG